MITTLSCLVCAGAAPAFDVVDFGRSCLVPRDGPPPLTGHPIYYHRCDACGFCNAPEIAGWSPGEFADRIYNADYVRFDPDYVEVRPRANARQLIANFGAQPVFQHLDYGGGAGRLSRLLVEAGWRSTSFDPFVQVDTDTTALGRFDLITAYEVFEHVPDPRDLVARLAALLAPVGLILFSTLVSDGRIVAGKRLDWWYAAPRNGHISLHTRKSLALLAGAAGLEFASASPGLHAYWRGSPPDWATQVLRRA